MATGTVNTSIVQGGTGYCQMPDGTLIQWGTQPLDAGSYAKQVAFYSHQYTALESIMVTAQDENVTAFATKASENAFYVGRRPVTAANTIFWVTFGRWK